MTELLDVGSIDKAHGLRGEVVVTLRTDRTERLDPGSVLQTERGSLRVVAAAPHQHRWRVRFAEIATREDADAWRGTRLLAEPIEDPDVWFVHQMIDRPVQLPDGTVVGRCTAVIENPAYDVLELDVGALVPMPFVLEVRDDAIVVDPPEGLLDLR